VAGKITGVDGSRPASSGTGRVGQRSTRGTVAASSSGDTSEVHITDTATQLAALEQSVRDLPAVDEARVASIRSAISQGTYQVSSEQVAERLTQLEQALGSASSEY
jgi:negative regulator of flagellin synthesis FlgM